MATACADGTGKVFYTSQSFFADRNTDGSQRLPSATVATVDFDESTNAALLADLLANPATYTISGGNLLKLGVTQSITSASALYAILSAVVTGVPKSTLETFLVALWNGTATSAQQQKAIAYIGVLLHLKFGFV